MAFTFLHRLMINRKTLLITATLATIGHCAENPSPVPLEAPKESSSQVSLLRGKRRLVVLGTGWAAVSLLSNLKPGLYDVTVVSPRNYHLFTPLLPSLAVGTVETRTIAEPIRHILLRTGHMQSLASSERSHARFYEAAATAIDFDRRVIKCIDNSPVTPEQNTFEVPYDVLVIAVGASTNTFGIPGVEEHCIFLKDIDHASAIRDRICDAFETASLPCVSPQQRAALLSFVVAGAGPTGVEIAAEIHDFVHHDLVRCFPKEVIDACTIKLVEAAKHVLNTYDQAISHATERHFSRLGIQVLTDSLITAVHPTHLCLRKLCNQKPSSPISTSSPVSTSSSSPVSTASSSPVSTSTSPDVEVLPFGLCIWTTGISPAPLTRHVQLQFPQVQTNRNCLVTDTHLRVILSAEQESRDDRAAESGAEQSRVYALGDCATTVQSSFLSQAEALFRQFDTNGDGGLQLDEFRECLLALVRARPDKALFGRDVLELFEATDANADGVVSAEEFAAMLKKVDCSNTSYPATAQVAAQQGEYLASLLNKPNTPAADLPPFAYHHYGSFAYVGAESAVLDLSKAVPSLRIFGSTLDGAATMLLWRASYFSMQLSFRNKLALLADWSKAKIFGRDVSRV